MNSQKTGAMPAGGKAALAYSAAAVICLLALAWIYGLWRADLSVPFEYDGDAVCNSFIVKGIIDNGWFLHNGYVGMPTGLDLYDYPMWDNLHLLLIKVISLFSHNYAVVLNVFYILTFPLVTLSGVFVLRRFGVSYPVSVLVGLLYAFLPYHFGRGEGHLFLSAYYTVPLAVMVALWVFSEEPPLYRLGDDGRLRFDLKGPRSVASLVICVLASSSGIYYPFFTCFFFMVAGLSASVSRKDKSHAVAAALLIGVILAGVIVNVSPTLAYQHRHGKNKEAVVRDYAASEVAGLKIIQMLLPVELDIAANTGGRVKSVTRRYNRQAPLLSENKLAGLGFVGGFGFLVLVGALLYRYPPQAGGELYRELSILNVFGVLLATVGGFGSLFSLLVSSDIRSYNRISVYIAFFSLFMVGLLLDRWSAMCRKAVSTRALYSACLVGLLFTGLGEVNIRKPFAEHYGLVRERFYADEAFVNEIEKSVPAHAMIFQLPYAPFPEKGVTCGMNDYEHFKAYLHSDNLRWSYGTMKGRDGDFWQQYVSDLPARDFVKVAALAGFSGIYIDRFGYPDNGKEVEAGLQSVLGTRPLTSADGRRAFYAIPGPGRGPALSGGEPSRLPWGTGENTGSTLPASLKPRGHDTPFSIDAFKYTGFAITVSGWAVDGRAGDVAGGLFIKIDDKVYPAGYGKDRADVARHFGMPSYRYSGFSASVPAEFIGKGRHNMSLVVLTKDKAGYYEPGQRKAFELN